MLQRMLGTARLDLRTFAELDADPGATSQALRVVALVALATGTGAQLTGGSPVLASAVSVAFWAFWVAVSYIVGKRYLSTPETNVTWSRLIRTTGFAQTPGVLRVFIFLPSIGLLLALASLLWQFVTMTLAVRQAMDYRSLWRAAAVVGLALVLTFVTLRLFIGGPGAPA